MTDQFDRASDLEIAQREAAIAEARQNVGTGASALFCEFRDCGEPIPQARREAVPGVRFCVDCQMVHERAVYIRKTYR